jgi:hypothetical protein
LTGSAKPGRSVCAPVVLAQSFDRRPHRNRELDHVVVILDFLANFAQPRPARPAP